MEKEEWATIRPRPSTLPPVEWFEGYNLGKIMKGLLVFALLLSIPALADSSFTAQRDVALKQIHSCLEQNYGSSPHCKGLEGNIQVLVNLYKDGDKSVLPTLFMFPNMTEFLADALTADPEPFLTALSHLPEKDQRAVATGIAGGMFGLRDKERVEKITATLSRVQESQRVRLVAQLCLEAVEQRNAMFVVSYFPPGTFTRRAGDFTLRIYSNGMYALGEKPLWPATETKESTYRLTYLPTFGDATVVSLTVMPDGHGQIAIKSMDRDNETVTIERISAVSNENVLPFLSTLNRAHFWEASTELPAPRGRHRTDGEEWILEDVKDGDYHVAVRWSPNFEQQNGDEILFAEAGTLLFKLAGCKHPGGCT
jgi:hypothetical protein